MGDPDDAPRARGAPHRLAGAGLPVLLAAVVVLAGTASAREPGGPADASPAAASVAAPPVVPAPSSAPLQDPHPLPGDAPAPGVVPARLVIPDVGVDAAVPPLRLGGDGTLLPPENLADAGWYAGSAVPGAVGPAVLAGHVDDTRQAGVFARLHELRPGARITVLLSDGSGRRYRMDRSVDVAKTAFPTAEVYGATPTSQLRLITCNGPYDFEAMHYRNNLVVFAVPAD